MKKFKQNISALSTFLFYNVLFLIALFLLRKFALGEFANVKFLDNQVFTFDYVLNSGAAFGLLKQQSSLLCGIAAFVLCFIVFYIFKNYKKISDFEMNILAMISSGILANTYERLQTGVVVDYINLAFIDFPVFNVADVYICVGALILVFILFFKR